MKHQKAKPSRPAASSTRKKVSSKSRASQRSPSTPDVAAVSSSRSVQHGGDSREEFTPTSEVRSVRPIDAATAAEYQRMYEAAWTSDAAGRLQLDVQRFAQALADALVDPLTEQDVYSRALLAAAEGQRSLFKEDAIHSELKAAS